MRGMTTDDELMRLATLAGADLLDAEKRLVTAESCTGGWVAKLLTDIAGSSGWYDGGVVAYSNQLKQSLLGVRPSTLASHGARNVYRRAGNAGRAHCVSSHGHRRPRGRAAGQASGHRVVRLGLARRHRDRNARRARDVQRRPGSDSAPGSRALTARAHATS